VSIKRYTLKIFELAMIILCSINLTFSQQREYRFQRYETKDGLAYSHSNEIVQDKHGFLWISHLDGLSRFDGYKFIPYKYDPDQKNRRTLNQIIFGLATDLSGNVYVVTDQSLLRHDFATDDFEKFTNDFPPAMHCLKFDGDRTNVWVGTHQRGLYSINLLTGETTRYQNVGKDEVFDADENDINAIEDFGPALALATNKGLWLYDKATKRFFRPNIRPQDTTVLLNSVFVRFIKQVDGSLWSQKVILDAKEGVPLKIRNVFLKLDSTFKILKTVEIPKDIVFNVCAISNDIIWMGSQGEGLIRYDVNADLYERIEYQKDDPYSLSSNVVTSIFFDRDANLWVGTSNGISVLRNSGLIFSNVGLGEGKIDASLLVNTGEKECVLIGQRTSPVTLSDNINRIRTADIGDGRSKSPIFSETTQLKGYGITRFWFDSKRLWVSVSGGGVFGFDDLRNEPVALFKHDPRNPNTISHHLVSCVISDSKGNLLVGVKRGGIDFISTASKYGEDGSVEHFTHKEDDTTSIQSTSVYSLLPYTDTTVWVVTETGLDLMVRNAGTRKVSFRHLLKGREPPLIVHRTNNGRWLVGTTGGLYEITDTNSFSYKKIWNKYVSAIQEDNGGRLWLYGSESIFMLDELNGVQAEFRQKDGVIHANAITDAGKMHKASDGTIIVVGEDGVTTFDPSLFKHNASSTKPMLTDLRVNNFGFSGNAYAGNDGFEISSDVRELDRIVLDHKHNNFYIEFSAMEMTAPEKNLYHHRLEGYDPDWIESDYKNRTATYTNLNAGTYTFKVKASNHHGVWSDNERTLNVIILPPPWKTWWAYTIYALFVLGLLFMSRRMIVQRERLKGSLKLAKVEQEKEHFELEKAKEVDRIKTSFFTNISHEFRTPLTLIQGPVQDLLDKYSSEPKTKEKLKLVQRNSDLLLKLINQLLDLAKLDAGNLKVEKSNVDVMRFVRATGGSFTSLAAQKDISIHINVPVVPCYALFDRDKLETILINLINNAIKFTPSHGSVHVNAEVKNNRLSLSVKDTGIGIPNDQHEKIFERFHQVSESHKEVGTGIGLALVKELVLLLGGTIAVNSTVCEGSEFIVHLPLEIAEASEDHIDLNENEPAIEQPTVHIVQSTITVGHSEDHNGAEIRPQLLVVEDNADLRSFIIESLGNEFKFLEAENGRQGLEVATTEIPDLIISDVMMPEMDGITMAGKIKTDQRSSHIPLILLTAKSTEDSKLLGLKSGADDYLTKPFNREELLLKVRNSINRQIKLREKLRAEVMSNAPAVEVMSEDERFLIRVKEKILERLSDEQLSVESLADDIGISRVHLYRKVSGLTGLSVNELIRKLRLQRAAQLLGQQWGPVSQVAYEVGYSNLSYFSKVFKEEFGALPSEYAEKYL
jgi:signal transduction histidine kinase/DNA-binding response OmpR family regulator/ligand-binding sensor domain-containing protein